MSEQALATAQKQSMATTAASHGAILQRKCACGTHTMAGATCAECKSTKSGLQRQLTIGARNDSLEREADRAADRVMTGPVEIPVGHTLSRLQRDASASMRDGDAAPPSVGQALADPGTPLQSELRENMDQRFGFDFSRVRVHTGTSAEQSAREIDASAYTVGNDIVFGSGQWAPATSGGRRLIAHELTHVVQQSGQGGAQLGPSGILSQHSQNCPFGALLQRQETTTPPATDGAQPTGDSVRSEVEALFKAFETAKTNEAKNTAAMQAVRVIIRAYNMSTKGLNKMRFNPSLNPKHHAETGEVEGNPRASEVEFGPGAFKSGFEWLVHIVAHELEHVRQNLIGGYHRGNEDEPVSEFLSYNGSVLQVQNVAGPPKRGLLGAMKAEAGKPTQALPPLKPDELATTATSALQEFAKMPDADQKKYRQELASSRDKLFERLKNEAPAQLRPPPKFTPEWARWYDDKPPSDDPFTMEYQDWLDARKSAWLKVKDIWKRFDQAFRIH
jgi:hypothetical protein